MTPDGYNPGAAEDPTTNPDHPDHPDNQPAEVEEAPELEQTPEGEGVESPGSVPTE